MESVTYLRYQTPDSLPRKDESKGKLGKESIGAVLGLGTLLKDTPDSSGRATSWEGKSSWGSTHPYAKLQMLAMYHFKPARIANLQTLYN